MTQAARLSGMATASLILGFVGLCAYAVNAPLLWFLPLLTIIMGHAALNTINKSGGAIHGIRIARAGLILGYLEIALNIVPYHCRCQQSAGMSRSHALAR